MITSGQRTLTKSRIAPALNCHPRGGRVHPETALSPRSAVPCGQVCSPALLRRLLLTQSNASQSGERPPKLSLPLGESGPPPNTCFLGPVPSLQPIPHVDDRVSRFGGEGSSLLCSTGKPIETDHTTSVARGCIFALCECDVA